MPSYAPRTPIPYARSMYDSSASDARLADLARRRTDSAARSARERAQISADLGVRLGDLASRTIQSLGQIPAERQRQEEQSLLNQERRASLQERTEARDARQQEARNKQTARSILGLSIVKGEDGVSTIDREMALREYQAANIMDQWPAFEESLNKIDAAHREVNAQRVKALATIAQNVAQHGNTPEAFKIAGALAVDNELIKPEDLQRVWQQVGGDQATPDTIGAVMSNLMGLGGIKPETQKNQTIVPPGAAVLDKDNREVYKNPSKPSEGPAVGSFEDFVVQKYGPRPTPEQIADARRVYGDAGRVEKPMLPPGTLPPMTQRRVDMKSSAFNQQPAVKKAQVMADSIGFAQSLDTNTKNPADDQALIYAFAKAMDPESVVREGEYATVQKYAQSWAQTMGFNAARIFSNSTFLTPEARANMKATILSRFDSARKQYDAVRKSYIDQINQITGTQDGETYLTDYGAAFPAGVDAKAPKKNPNR